MIDNTKSERRRKEAIMACMDKPLRLVLQMDAFADRQPAFSDDQDGDQDGDDLFAGWQYELRRLACIPVRVQIMDGTSAETALRLLRKMIRWLERDPALLERYEHQETDELPF